MPTKVFLIEPRTPARSRVTLRRFRAAEFDAQGNRLDSSPCPGPFGYHNASSAAVAEVPTTTDENGYFTTALGLEAAGAFAEHAAWPTACSCGYQFTADDARQVNADAIYGRADGQPGEWTLRDAPVGAMWNADWYPDSPMWRGADGLALIVKLPNGQEWSVDMESSNCTRKGDAAHKCWVRHGDPRTGDLHVDKNGNTCAAGAGSILSGNYHGFLHHGFLTDGC